MEDNTNISAVSEPLLIHGIDEEKQIERGTNLLYSLEAQDGAQYTRTVAGNLVKTKDGSRRENSTKVQKKKNK